MIVLIAGMQRSGSTFSFNIVREVLLARGAVHQEATNQVVEQLTADCDHLLIKSHEPDDLALRLVAHGAVRVVCTMRRPEDAAASWITTFGFPEDQAIATIKAWLRTYEKIKPFALTVPYDLLEKHPVVAAHRIGRYISPDVGWREAYRIARRYSKENIKKRTDALDRASSDVVDVNFSWYDRETFFHRRHVSSLDSQPAESRLPLDQLQRIRAAFNS
ncbi:hypothetical protein P3T20_001330 [Paraburkholderia sp. GAS206C]|jgi:hypothetical protein